MKNGINEYINRMPDSAYYLSVHGPITTYQIDRHGLGRTDINITFFIDTCVFSCLRLNTIITDSKS